MVRFTSAQTASPKHWELGISILDADLSPDEHLLAVTTESPPFPRHGENVEESAELWDYRHNKQMAKGEIASYGASLRSSPDPVRFTFDGALLIAAEPTKIHVLNAATLKQVRLVELPLGHGFRIRHVETSPVAHVAVIAADEGGLSGVLFAYDLDTGRELLQEKTPSAVTSISWKPDGRLFAVAAPWPCSDRGGLEVFSVRPWAAIKSLKGKNVISVAFSNNRLYGVQTSFCKGSVFNRHLGMDVIDIYSWKSSKRIFLPKQDIHDSVSFANGKLLADTGTVATEFDALDGTTNAVADNAQITVWNNGGSVIYTSNSLPINRGVRVPFVRMRLSRTGTMALVVDRNVRIFQFP